MLQAVSQHLLLSRVVVSVSLKVLFDELLYFIFNVALLAVGIFNSINCHFETIVPSILIVLAAWHLHTEAFVDLLVEVS